MKFEQLPSAKISEKKTSPEVESKQSFMPTPESITSLEDADSDGIGWGKKREIFLAACEIKPATHFSIFELDSQDQINTEKLLVDLGLQYEVVMEEATDPNDGKLQGKYLDYIVAHTPENLRRASEAWQNLRQEETCNEEEFGLVMGYPATAVEAFQKTIKGGLYESPESPILSNNETRELLTPEEFAFTNFKLSRDHWKQELEWVHEIIEITKKYAPNIYAGTRES